MSKAHVTHPELKCTFCLGILGVKKNPNGTSYTQLGVITKGTVIEVRCSSSTSKCYLAALPLPSTACCAWARRGASHACIQLFLPLLCGFRLAALADENVHVSCNLLLQVNVSELGLVTPGGKVVWGKYAQVTNNPENDGCINAVLLV